MYHIGEFETGEVGPGEGFDAWLASVKAEALREAAATATYGDTQRWLNARADTIEQGD